MNIRNIGLVGYGEVGKIFGAGLKAQDGVQSVAAWDIRFTDGPHREGLGPRRRVHNRAMSTPVRLASLFPDGGRE